MKSKKAKPIFFCSSCGYESAQWLGKCPACGQWNSFVEHIPADKNVVNKTHLTNFSSEVIKLQDAPTDKWQRYETGIKEFDIIVGGGVASGSIVLLGGSPGIGKSTLMLQVCDKFAQNENVLYVSGEESVYQVKARAMRLGINSAKLFLMSETNLENILDAAEKTNPKFIVIDSIQTVYSAQISGAPASILQIKEVTARLLEIAKTKNIVIFLLGHVTKDGDLAGPRVLEHIVDTVLYFENEKQHIFRILRSHKNRFGPTNEIGIFEMTQKGLMEVLNPSEIFLSSRQLNAPGNIITASIEGTRPLLLEVQALCVHTSYAIARRTVSGYDANRVAILIAVLEKLLNLPLEMQDIFANIAGGVRVRETAADLAFACALVSANAGFICPKDLVVFGEVGLLGEIRSVSFAKERLLEAQKLGFKKAIIPAANMKNLHGKMNIEICPVQTIDEAIKFLKQ
ncbi:MAG: DNA repair protein RadA [Elusimicrobiota bacterium]|jgi:DNA repair protein RadA/Sms|nr:DNA repair protein RadA [Elusimicrobiota bacterium]